MKSLCTCIFSHNVEKLTIIGKRTAFYTEPVLPPNNKDGIFSLLILLWPPLLFVYRTLTMPTMKWKKKGIQNKEKLFLNSMNSRILYLNEIFGGEEDSEIIIFP